MKMHIELCYNKVLCKLFSLISSELKKYILYNGGFHLDSARVIYSTTM